MTDADAKHDQKVRSLLDDPKLSAFKKYQLMAVGKPGFFAFLNYELLTGLCGGLPGALGYALRKLCYPRLFNRMGKGCVIGRHCTFRGTSRIHLGRGVLIDDNVVIDARGTAEIHIADGVLIARNTIIRARSGVIRLGEHTDIGSNCIVSTDSQCTLGREVLVAAYAYLCASGNHRTDALDTPILRQGFDPQGGIHIGDGAWIGAHAMLMDGASVGAGCIIGAHAVVRAAIPAMHVAVGAPARAIKERG